MTAAISASPNAIISGGIRLITRNGDGRRASSSASPLRACTANDEPGEAARSPSAAPTAAPCQSAWGPLSGQGGDPRRPQRPSSSGLVSHVQAISEIGRDGPDERAAAPSLEPCVPRRAAVPSIDQPAASARLAPSTIDDDRREARGRSRTARRGRSAPSWPAARARTLTRSRDRENAARGFGRSAQPAPEQDAARR